MSESQRVQRKEDASPESSPPPRENGAEPLNTWKQRVRTGGQRSLPLSVKLSKNKKINKSHPEFELTFDMMLGIRTVVSQIESKPRAAKLSNDDFSATIKLKFPHTGSSMTPAHKMRDFKFKDYSPEVFRRIRERFGILPADYLMCVCGNFNYLEFISNSKSGQFFFYSHDGRYMIKTISHGEAKFLLKILPAYYHHICENPNTLLTPFYGLHRVTPYKKSEKHFLIMGSVFYASKYINRTFDLKGSMHGRLAKPKEIARGDECVYKDQDFVNQKVKIQVGPTVAENLMTQLRRDVEFLRALNIMDYSLLLGVHYENKADAPKVEQPDEKDDPFDEDDESSDDNVQLTFTQVSLRPREVKINGKPDVIFEPDVEFFDLTNAISLQPLPHTPGTIPRQQHPSSPQTSFGFSLSQMHRSLPASAFKYQVGTDRGTKTTPSLSLRGNSSLEDVIYGPGMLGGGLARPSSPLGFGGRPAPRTVPGALSRSMTNANLHKSQPLRGTSSGDAQVYALKRHSTVSRIQDTALPSPSRQYLSTHRQSRYGLPKRYKKFSKPVDEGFVADEFTPYGDGDQKTPSPSPRKPSTASAFLPPSTSTVVSPTLDENAPLAVGGAHGALDFLPSMHESGLVEGLSPDEKGADAFNGPRGQSVFSQVQGRDENSKPTGVWYYMGIIDILTQYTMKKKMESAFKSLTYSRQAISAVHPNRYARRFIAFLDKATQ